MSSVYHFDEAAAQHAVDFIQTQCRHVEGESAGKPLILLPWQQKITRDLFGWKNEDGTRRYRIAYIELPRKNGKSTYVAAMALYLLLCDKEAKPQVYSAAGDRAQARIVYETARDMVAANPLLEAETETYQYRIVGKRLSGFYTSLSSQAFSKHGFNAHGILFDEVHVQKTRDLWDVLNTSVGARRQPLTLAITTAGHDRQSICYELHCRALAALADPDSDPTFYPCIFAASDTDDWKSEETWAKANPSLGFAIKIEYLRAQFEEAIRNPAFENTFKNLHLNLWTEQAVRAIPMDAWDQCPKDATEEKLLGRTCYAGLDLASTRDIAALSLVFPEEDDHYSALTYFWVPEESNSKRTDQDRRKFKGFVKSGLIETTEGNQTDYSPILGKFSELAEKFDIREIAVDPWNSSQFTQMLMASGYPATQIFQFQQSAKNYTEPMTKMLGLVADHKLDTGGCPVMRWMATNFTTRKDSSGNIRPDKSTSQDKIDGMTALLMGMGRAILHDHESSDLRVTWI